MRSSVLPEYLSLNRLSDGLVSFSRYHFVKIQPRDPISQKSNSCVTDGRTDGRTDRRTDTPSYRDARTHQKITTNLCHTHSRMSIKPFGSEAYDATTHLAEGKTTQTNLDQANTDGAYNGPSYTRGTKATLTSVYQITPRFNKTCRCEFC